MGDQLQAITADGVRLALHATGARGPRRGALLCTHAMMANAAYFRHLADHLAGAGLDVFCLDWRGHGGSKPPYARQRPGWSFDDYVQLDLPAAVAAVAGAAGVGTADLLYLGHSLGGLAGLAGFATGAAPPPRRLALFATSCWLPGPRGPLSRRLLAAAFERLSRRLGWAPVTLLRLGSEDEPHAYAAQFFAWARSGRWLSRTGLDYMEAIADLHTPVWPVTGAGDRLSRPADAQVIVDRLPAAGRLRVVGRAQGDAIDADHFGLITRRELAPMWDDVAAWLIAP